MAYNPYLKRKTLICGGFLKCQTQVLILSNSSILTLKPTPTPGPKIPRSKTPRHRLSGIQGAVDPLIHCQLKAALQEMLGTSLVHLSIEVAGDNHRLRAHQLVDGLAMTQLGSQQVAPAL